jgi:hypothetical protein
LLLTGPMLDSPQAQSRLACWCFTPQSAINVNTGTSVFPYPVKEYSTRSQGFPKAVREMMPSLSSSRSCSVGYFSARLRQRAEQLAEPKRLRFQRIQDHRFPFTVD